MKNWEFHFHATLMPQWAHSTALCLYRRDHVTGEVEYAEAKWKPAAEDANLPDFLRVNQFDRNVLQMLMDDLYRSGLRPTDAQGSTGQLAAVQEHVKDLRQITFHLLKVNQPA
jgi:hypothetical protein